MSNNQRIKRYLHYLESKLDAEMEQITNALKECDRVPAPLRDRLKFAESKDERWVFYNCLLNQGLTFKQIGILEGISKQAVNEFFKKHSKVNT